MESSLCFQNVDGRRSGCRPECFLMDKVNLYKCRSIVNDLFCICRYQKQGKGSREKRGATSEGSRKRGTRESRKSGRGKNRRGRTCFFLIRGCSAVEGAGGGCGCAGRGPERLRTGFFLIREGDATAAEGQGEGLRQSFLGWVAMNARRRAERKFRAGVSESADAELWIMGMPAGARSG